MAQVATRTVRNYIGGGWIEPDGEERQAVTNTATGEALAVVVLAGRAEVDRAVGAARAAFPAWRATPPLERARACFELKSLLEEAKDELAALVTRDNGKGLKDAA